MTGGLISNITRKAGSIPDLVSDWWEALQELKAQTAAAQEEAELLRAGGGPGGKKIAALLEEQANNGRGFLSKTYSAFKGKFSNILPSYFKPDPEPDVDSLGFIVVVPLAISAAVVVLGSAWIVSSIKQMSMQTELIKAAREQGAGIIDKIKSGGGLSLFGSLPTWGKLALGAGGALVVWRLIR